MSLLTLFLGVAMLLPLSVALIYGEGDAIAFAISFLICLMVGAISFFLTGRTKSEIRHKEGFAIVAFGWFAVAFFGSLPYLFSGAAGTFSDAFFESASGFTTTGNRYRVA